jgi:hypothetical protein
MKTSILNYEELRVIPHSGIVWRSGLEIMNFEFCNRKV